MVRDQWEGTEDVPVSIAKYLDDLYQKMEEMSKLAGRKDQEAKDASKKWLDQQARDRKFEMGDNVLEGGMDTMSGKRISVSQREQCSSSSTRLRQTVHCTDECITEGGRSSPQSIVGRGGEACCLQLNPAQAKYTATEKECLAVVLGL